MLLSESGVAMQETGKAYRALPGGSGQGVARCRMGTRSGRMIGTRSGTMEEGDRDKVWHDGSLEIWGPENILLQNILANICQKMQPLCEAPYRRFNREAARPCRRGMIFCDHSFFSSRFFLHSSILLLYRTKSRACISI
jgi:hypothetical protein